MRTINLFGQRFGRLVVTEMVANAKRADKPKCLCSCDCGGSITLPSGALTTGRFRSCGCAKNDEIKHGLRKTPTYNTWYSMLERCRNPKNASWRNYGARGIRVCERWHELANFIADMGMRPDGKTIDRIDPNGNYEPGNCRWADADVQQRTKRNVVCSYEFAQRIRSGEFAGLTNKAIAKIVGCDPSTISRIKSGEVWR